MVMRVVEVGLENRLVSVVESGVDGVNGMEGRRVPAEVGVEMVAETLETTEEMRERSTGKLLAPYYAWKKTYFDQASHRSQDRPFSYP